MSCNYQDNKFVNSTTVFENYDTYIKRCLSETMTKKIFIYNSGKNLILPVIATYK